MNRIVSFIKKESVLCVALALSLVSSFFVTPDAQYVSYIDFKTLALLFCLMAVMSGFTKAGLFSFCADALLKRTGSARGIQAVLILLCFCFSAIITNDVALITFVPFSVTVLTLANRTDLLPITVVLQTIAANMGSCLTPIGNPQNIYIYSISDISFGQFFVTMLPYALATLIALMVCILFTKGSRLSTERPAPKPIDGKLTLFYTLLFIISLLSVLKILNYLVCFIIILVSLLIFDRKTVLKVDYSLLFTFVGFFVFVGNMGRIPFFREQIELLIEGKEIVFSALASQIISNVPAALLLSNFTDNLTDLLIGVNIGGLGTLIASMASLISYKYIARALPDKKGKYFAVFTLFNLVLLGFMLLISLIL